MSAQPITNTTPEKIIIDCDPGHDDAIAIMLALASPELEVLGITVTYGNVGLENTTRNAMVMREICGSNLIGGSSVPIFAGANGLGQLIAVVQQIHAGAVICYMCRWQT